MAKAKPAPVAASAEAPRGKSRTFYMTDDAYDRLTKQAARQNRTRSGQVNHLVEQEDARQ